MSIETKLVSYEPFKVAIVTNICMHSAILNYNELQGCKNSVIHCNSEYLSLQSMFLQMVHLLNQKW